MEASPDSTPVAHGPIVVAARNWVAARVTPATRIAGSTSRDRRHPHSITHSHPGTSSESGGSSRPTYRLTGSTSSPATSAATVTGTPAAAKATGELLATRQSSAAVTGGKPRPISMAEVTATGTPYPAVPSRNAPNAKATRSACSRRSGVRFARVALTISNCPDSTERRWIQSAAARIQRIGKSA